MTFFPTDEQLQIRDLARKFAESEVEPLAGQIDRDDETPRELIDRCAELGFFGLFIPEEYGGSGASLSTVCMVVEEIAKASPALAGLLAVQMILCPGLVSLIANEEQKQRLLPKSATGERLLAFSQTEPAGAANTARHLTRLTADGEGYRLNGAKLFCSQGEAETYLVMPRTSIGDKQGYGVVIVEKDAPGFEIGKYEDKLGWRGTNTGPISFNDVAVPPENVMGDLLSGNADFGMMGQANLMAHSASSLGCAEGLFDKTVAYINSRELYGEPMHRLSPVADRMSDVLVKIQASRALLYASTKLWDDGLMTSPMGSVSKIFVCESAFDACHVMLQMWGGSGMMDSTGVNRYFRDARTNLIAEGSTEIHSSVLAHGLGFTQTMATAGSPSHAFGAR